MRKYTLKVELTDEQAQMIEEEVKLQIEWEKANGYAGVWTVERELRYILEKYLKELEMRRKVRGEAVE